MEGALSLGQSHVPCIRPFLSLQRGGNGSSASFCTPVPTEVTGSEQKRDAGQGRGTRMRGKAEGHVLWGLLLPGNYSPFPCMTLKKISPQITCTIDPRTQTKDPRQHFGEAGSRFWLPSCKRGSSKKLQLSHELFAVPVRTYSLRCRGRTSLGWQRIPGTTLLLALLTVPKGVGVSEVQTGPETYAPKPTNLEAKTV